MCPKCKNPEGTTSFIKYTDDGYNNLIEKRECDDPNYGCKYEVKYKPVEILIPEQN